MEQGKQDLEESKELNPLAADYQPEKKVEETKHDLKADATVFEPEVSIVYKEDLIISHCSSSEKFDGRYGNLNFVLGDNLVTYDPVADTWVSYSEWSSKSKAPEAKYYKGVMTVANSFILTGGYNGIALKHSYHVDISNNFGTLINTMSVYEMQEARYLHSVAYYNNKVYVIGGQSSPTSYLSSVEAFENETWVSKASLNKPRSFSTVIVNNNGIWVAGGFSGPSEIAHSIEVYNDSQWKLIDVNLPMLAGMAAVPVDKFNSSFYVLGGSDGSKSYDRVLLFNTENSNFEVANIKLLYPRAGSSVCWSSGFFWVVGGGQLVGEVWNSGSGKETKPMPLSIYAQIEAANFVKARE